MTRRRISNLIQEEPWILRGTLVERFLKCRRPNCAICQDQGGHGPVYYLSIRGDDGKTHMVYIPKDRLEQVRAGVTAYKGLKEGLARVAGEDLRRWCKEARRT
jgi:hypothetical protein